MGWTLDMYFLHSVLRSATHVLAVLTNGRSALNYGNTAVHSAQGGCRGTASGEGQGAVVGACRQSGTVQLYHSSIVILLPLEVVILSKIQVDSSPYPITCFPGDLAEMTYLVILPHHSCCMRCVNLSIGLVRVERLANVALPFTVQS